MKLLKISLLTLLVAIMTACGSNDTFKIHGKVAENRTLNLRIVYFGDDNVNNVLTAARDGVFEFEGKSPEQGALVEVLDNDYRVLARLFAVNGEEYNVALNVTTPRLSKVSGSEVNDAWTKWIADNANTLNLRNAKIINEAVERYVKAHKNDLLSTLLLLTEYDTSIDAVGAQKLMASIAADARPASMVEGWVANVAAAGESKSKAKVLPITYVISKDSLGTFNPKKQDYALLVFSDENSGRSDSILPKLRELVKKYPNRKRLAIVDFSLDNDTFAWRRGVRADSITWTAAWGAGSVAASGVERLGLTSIPYFIVTDSAGTQLYRGTSITAANDLLTKRLR